MTICEYASEANFCHHALPAASPTFAHQTTFCLSENYKTCPIFRLTEKQPLPREISVVNNDKNFRGNFSYRIFGGIFLLLAIALTAAIAIFGDLSYATAIPEGTRFVLATDPNGVITGSTISTAGPSATVNQTRSACRPPDGSIPYTVEPNDSIFQLSLTLEIKVVDLLAANCMREDSNLQAGEIIYIPPKRTNTPTKPSIITPSSTVRATTRVTPFFTSTQTRENQSNPPTAIPQPSRTPVPEPPTAVPPQPTPTSPPQPTLPPPPEPTSAPPTPGDPPPPEPIP